MIFTFVPVTGFFYDFYLIVITICVAYALHNTKKPPVMGWLFHLRLLLLVFVFVR